MADPTTGIISCEVGGGDITDPPGAGGGDEPQIRYLYTRTDAVVGDCYYWSATPGGLDSWDPADDAAVIAITTTLPECPVVAVSDPEIRAWELVRSWYLAEPSVAITPEASGITGLASHITAPPPTTIDHSEVLPDGRPLDVRARVTALVIDWGDGTTTNHLPDEASGYPDGTAAHTYTVKTCSAAYREDHPSGGLCHPTLSAYSITVTNVWTGEYDVGAGWVALGTLDRTTAFTYDVDEAVGIVSP